MQCTNFIVGNINCSPEQFTDKVVDFFKREYISNITSLTIKFPFSVDNMKLPKKLQLYCSRFGDEFYVYVSFYDIDVTKDGQLLFYCYSVDYVEVCDPKKSGLYQMNKPDLDLSEYKFISPWFQKSSSIFNTLDVIYFDLKCLGNLECDAIKDLHDAKLHNNLKEYFSHTAFSVDNLPDDFIMFVKQINRLSASPDYTKVTSKILKDGELPAFSRLLSYFIYYRED